MIRIIIPANEAEEGCDFMQLDSTPKVWRRWCIGSPKPSHREILWSREIEPWVSVEERLPEDGVEILVKIEDSEEIHAAYIKKSGGWAFFDYVNHMSSVTHWLDTSLFPVPPKRDECEEAWLKWESENLKDVDSAHWLMRIESSFKAAWKAAREGGL